MNLLWCYSTNMGHCSKHGIAFANLPVHSAMMMELKLGVMYLNTLTRIRLFFMWDCHVEGKWKTVLTI